MDFSNPAVTGFAGVIVGGVMTIAKDYLLAKRKESKAEKYLCILVISELERFATGCEEVARDDGEEDQDGCNYATTSMPKFDPHSIDVEWQLLPLPMLYRTLDLATKISTANRNIEGVSEYIASPPDYSEFFETRQLECITLGLEALDIASSMRVRAGLSQVEYGEWNPKKYFEDRERAIENAIAARAERHRILMARLDI